jgi:transcriptional regulator with XRE-family HTH domain
MARSARSISPESRALIDKIRRLREQGLSVREVARRTELSKSYVHNIVTGKRGISAARAAAASERLSQEQPALALVEGQGITPVNPLNRRERQKIGRHWRAVQDARRTGDFRGLRRRFGRTVVKTAEGEFRLETNPDVLLELDDAGLLNIDEVFHYEPTAKAA